MKFISYSGAYYGGGHNAGAETTLHGFNKALQSLGHEVDALLSRPHKDGSGPYVLDGIKVQSFASKKDPFFQFPQYDITVAQLETAQRAWIISRQLGKPSIQLVHNNTEYSLNIGERYSDYLIHNSYHVQRDFEFTEKPSMVLYPIINPDIYRVDTSREYITLINLSDGTAPWYDKGYRVFYEMARRFPDQKFLGVEGAYGVQHHEDLPNVTILPHQNNILQVYRKTKLLLVPSTVESFGRVAVEAAASGIPSISSDLPGPVEAGCSARYIDPEEPDYWEQQIKDLLAFDGDPNNPWETMARDASAHLWTQTQQQIEDLGSFLEAISEDYKS